MAVLLGIYFYSAAAMSNMFSTLHACRDVEIVPRTAWGARLPLENDTMTMPVKQVFIHHTAGRECNDRISCIMTMQSIQNYHMDDLNWDDIGYNFLIGGDGRVYEGRSWTRVGAHTYGFNRVAVAFSLMGNFQEKKPSEIMLTAAKNLLKCGKGLGHVTEDAALHGHRDASCTLCPGEELYKIIQTWPNFIAGPLPGYRCKR